jgi:membrane protease YdiL (CAAX protease family)
MHNADSSEAPNLPIAQSPDHSVTQSRRPGWTLWDVLLIVAVLAVAMSFTITIGLAVAGYLPVFAGLDQQAIVTNPLFSVPAQLVAYLVAFAFTRVYIELRAREGFWELIEWNLPARGFVVGAAAGGVLLALSVQIASRYLPIPEDLPITQLFRTREFVLVLAAFAIAVAPLAEEIFFRGLLFGALRSHFSRAGDLAGAGFVTWAISVVPFVWVYVRYGKLSRAGIALVVVGAGLMVASAAVKLMPQHAARLGTISAIAGTAFCFALIHQGQLAAAWAPLLVLFIVGVVLTAVRVRLRSVAASWIMHTAYNTTLFVLMFIGTNGFRNLDRIAR